MGRDRAERDEADALVGGPQHRRRARRDEAQRHRQAQHD
jgi:hypothetical protein